ncbi:MerR family transcriptional regulator [Aneurinibacillus tyrosinisolvens]|uniref:MerR family transcriptional regulator n=1 Tax=Aneurinibacillus tyrosinisolvens TaxID=1443435 RepID=UPI00063FD235|nr:MerR family transcriptional regulator [Aneurinibacillus tyrosinisolvens]
MYRQKGVKRNGKLYRIGELADLAGVSRRTIDYYTNLHLLKAERTHANYRLYSDDAVERLRFIECLKRQKLTLEEIKQRIEHWQSRSIAVDPMNVEKDLEEIQLNMSDLEQKLLELMSRLKTMDEKQAKMVARQISIHGGSFLHTLMILLGETPW